MIERARETSYDKMILHMEYLTTRYSAFPLIQRDYKYCTCLAFEER